MGKRAVGSLQRASWAAGAAPEAPPSAGPIRAVCAHAVPLARQEDMDAATAEPQVLTAVLAYRVDHGSVAIG